MKCVYSSENQGEAGGSWLWARKTLEPLKNYISSPSTQGTIATPATPLGGRREKLRWGKTLLPSSPETGRDSHEKGVRAGSPVWKGRSIPREKRRVTRW